MTTRFTLADLTVDIAEKSVYRGDDCVRLPDLSFGVLAAMVKSAPHTVSQQDLALEVWRTPHASDETIAQRVRLLRRALNDDPKAPRYIKTVRGAGYACAAPVQALFEQSNSPATTFRRNVVIGIASALSIAFVFALSYPLLWDGAGSSELPRAVPPTVVASLVDRARAQLQVQQAEETNRAIEMLQQAIELDSSNPTVQVALSFALSTRVTKFRKEDGDVVEAEALARRALRTDSQLSSAWSALGYALDAQGRVDEALSSYQRAYELNPSNVAAMSSAAYLLSIRGRLFESLVLEARAMSGDGYSRYAETQIALALDLIRHPATNTWRSRAQLLSPNQVVVLAEAAEAHLRRGEPVAALEVLSQASGQDGDSPRLRHLSGRATLLRGDIDGARREFVAAGDRAASDLAALNALLGGPKNAEQLIAATEKDMVGGDSWPGLRVQLAELHAALGDDEAALNLLSQAVDLGWRDTALLEHSPFLQSALSADAWIPIRQRIERELAMQRTLIENAPELVSILGENG